MTTFRRLTMAVLATAAFLVAAAAPAAAHAHQDILDGQYEITLGWSSEPPFTGVKNGLELSVERYVDGNATDDGHGHGARDQEPVTNMIGNMTVTYEYAGRTFEPVDLRGAWGEPGTYTAEITPTRSGEYTVHVKGTIDGEAFEVSMKPEAVRPIQDTMFPVEDASVEDLQQRIDDLEAQIEALQANAQQNANEPTDATPSGNDTPAPGLVVGALAAVGVAIALRRRG